MTTTGAHEYLSTACWHELNDGRPELHGSCRASCKFAPGGPEYCVCPNHPENDGSPAPQSWVDQARDAARRLLTVLESGGALTVRDPELSRLIRTDPDLFWLRGEEQPPGEWRSSPHQLPPGN
jgi:hypothetical protein